MKTPKVKLRWADKVKLALAVPDGRLPFIMQQLAAMKHLAKLNPKRYSFGMDYGKIYFQDKNWCGRKEAHRENISNYSSLQQILDLDLPQLNPRYEP